MLMVETKYKPTTRSLNATFFISTYYLHISLCLTCKIFLRRNTTFKSQAIKKFSVGIFSSLPFQNKNSIFRTSVSASVTFFGPAAIKTSKTKVKYINISYDSQNNINWCFTAIIVFFFLLIGITISQLHFGVSIHLQLLVGQISAQLAIPHN